MNTHNSDKNNHEATKVVNNQSTEQLTSQVGSLSGGIFLVTGTCIGAGMLGLSIATAAAGFYSSIGAFIIAWIVMTFTALAFLEVSLLLKGETNLISMAQITLGKTGKHIAWITSLLFLYSIMAAYTSGGTTMLSQACSINIKSTVELYLMSILFILPFTYLVYLGTKWVDYINRSLIFGLSITFILICITISTQHMDISQHLYNNAKYLLVSIPLLVTSFGYHFLIPTLKTYLNENVYKLRLAIIIGSLIPLVIYIIWEYIVLSQMETWEHRGLLDILHQNSNPGDLIIEALSHNNTFLSLLVTCFSFFTFSSSFVSVALGLFDLLSDGLGISKTAKGKCILSLLTFAPPVIYTFCYPRGFLLALGYAGVFAAILLIIYPALMAWHSRYIVKMESQYRVSGGKIGLALAILFGILVILMEILKQFSYLPVHRYHTNLI